MFSIPGMQGWVNIHTLHQRTLDKMISIDLKKKSTPKNLTSKLSTEQYRENLLQQKKDYT